MCQTHCRGRAEVELAYRCMLLRRGCLHDICPFAENLRYRFYTPKSEEVQQLG